MGGGLLISALMAWLCVREPLMGLFYTTNAEGYNGDAFQVCIDFGGKLGEVVVTDPDRVTNPKNIFYSFSCISDGAPLEIMRQESDQDGLLSEENGDGVKGAAAKTETGWAAEFALSWDQMYNDYLWKAWEEDKKIYVGSDEVLPLNIGCALYYLDRSETGGGVLWAAGTSNGQLLEDDVTPGVSWTCYDNGIQAKLEYEEGITFNCEGIVVLPITETTPEETEADCIIINTCAFIESAKKESIDSILDIAWLKEHNNLKGIVVTGCLAERYREELLSEIPEIDAAIEQIEKEVADAIAAQ